MSEQDNNNYNANYRSNSSEVDSIERRKADRRDVEDLDRRFNKIESKLDELTDAVVTIARVEEKISTVIEDNKEMKTTVNNHTTRIHEIELNESRNSANLKTIASISWTILGGLVTAIAGVLITLYTQ